jgi:putative hemolysin
VPREGDSVTWAGWKFEVIDMDGNAIDKILAIRINASATAELD